MLLYTEGGLVLGNSRFPSNAHLRYRSLKSDDETEFIFETVAIEPEIGHSEVSKVQLHFDFTQMEKVTVKYTFMESLLEIIIILPIVFALVLALHSFLSLVIFYKDFSEYVLKKYFSALEIE